MNEHDLYQELIASEGEGKVYERLHDMIYYASSIIAKRIVLQDKEDQIYWLYSNGFSADEIKKYIEQKE